MKPFSSFYSVLTLLFPLTQSTTPSNQLPILNHLPLPPLRNATLSDAPGITTIFLSAFASFPTTKYLYQFRDKYPKEHRQCMQENIERIFANPRYHTQVIDAPDDRENENEDKDIPLAAVAIWSRPSTANTTTRRLKAQILSTTTTCLHRDLNLTRALDYIAKARILQQRSIDDFFGASQLYLEDLATYPSYQSRGAGTRLVESGLTRARKEGLGNVTLLAQPTAETFYLRLGFERWGWVGIESVDGDREFRFVVMAKEVN